MSENEIDEVLEAFLGTPAGPERDRLMVRMSEERRTLVAMMLGVDDLSLGVRTWRSAAPVRPRRRDARRGAGRVVPAPHVQHYPRSLCATCWFDDLAWAPACGRGTAWAFTVVHVPGHDAWRDETPYTLALVELEEGPRLTTNIVGTEPAAAHVGMGVELAAERDTFGPQPLLQFSPVDTVRAPQGDVAQ